MTGRMLVKGPRVSPAPKVAPRTRPQVSSKAALRRGGGPRAGGCDARPGGLGSAARSRAVSLVGLVVGAQRWALVTAGDLMRTNIVTVSYAAPLSEVERVLADARVSGAPVVDQSGQIVGVISLRDLIERYAEDEDARPRRGHGFFHLSSEETLDEDFESFEVPEEAEETACDLMTAQVFSVPVEAGLKEIADVMCKHSVHRVLVTDGGRLLGLISTLDILDALRA